MGFLRRYGRTEGSNKWKKAKVLDKRLTQDGEALSEAEFVKRYGERGKLLWGKSAVVNANDQQRANGAEPIISREEFVEGLLRRTEPITERQFMRLEKKIHDALDSIEMLVDESLKEHMQHFNEVHEETRRANRITACAKEHMFDL